MPLSLDLRARSGRDLWLLVPGSLSRPLNSCVTILTPLLILTALLTAGCSSHVDQTSYPTNRGFAVDAVKQNGLIVSPTGECQAELVVSEVGGWLGLFVEKSRQAPRQAIARDVTGIAWFSGNLLVYSVGPIYGTPGVFVLNCRSMNTRTLVAPGNINPAYPHGADYFELQRIFPDKREVVFYYAPDVEVVDFTQFRTPKSLRTASLREEFEP